MIVLARSSSLDNWPKTKTEQKTEEKTTAINYPPKWVGWVGVRVGHLHTQEYHHPGRSTLCKFTNNNPFFTYCKVVSNCFLLFVTWKTNSEPFIHRCLFQSCFNLVLILLDMALSCGSAPNSSLACDSFTLEQYIIIIIHNFSIALFPTERAQRACSHTCI